MKRLLILAALALVACNGGELTEEAQIAYAYCEGFCDQCEGVDTCADTCFGQWSLYGGGEKAVCANEAYLNSLECQVLEGCGDPACGDPYNDMLRCAEDFD